jgi:cbb3-type cytochrome oxidase subunit 3
MRLSDAVGSAGLSVYAEVALVIFFATFVGIVIWTFARRNKARYDKMRGMPLENDEARAGRGEQPPADEARGAGR